MSEVSLTVKILMTASGLTGLVMFLLANFFLKKYKSLKLATGLMQKSANAFVFISWLSGYRQTPPDSLERVVCLIGFSIPLVMASITFIRVVLPAMLARKR